MCALMMSRFCDQTSSTEATQTWIRIWIFNFDYCEKISLVRFAKGSWLSETKLRKNKKTSVSITSGLKTCIYLYTYYYVIITIIYLYIYRLYYDVKIKYDDAQSDSYLLEFSVKNLLRVNWEGSKRLLFGSLLLLSADNFNSFLLFTVVDRKPDQLSRGRIKAKFEGESLPVYAMENNLIMAESSVFFEAYRSVLIALQRISPAHFPMEDYILCQNVSPIEPDYLLDIPDVSLKSNNQQLWVSIP